MAQTPAEMAAEITAEQTTTPATAPTEPVVTPPAGQPEVPVTPPEVPAETPDESSWLRSAAQARGLDASTFSGDAALAEAMFTQLDQGQKDQALVDIGRQMAPFQGQLADFHKWQAEQTATPDKPKTPETPEGSWACYEGQLTNSAPAYDSRWPNMVELDERGYYKAPEGIPSLAPVAEKMNVYRQFQTDAIQHFIGDPQKLIQSATAPQLTAMEKRITEANQKAIETAIQKQVADAEMATWAKSQEEELYIHDTTGQMQYDAQGFAMRTPKGHAMAEYATQAEQFGIKDPAAIRHFIDMGMERDGLSGRFPDPTQVAPPAAPATLPQAPPTVPVKRKFLDRVLSKNRGGTVPDPTAPEGSQQQNPSATMVEITDRITAERGGLN